MAKKLILIRHAETKNSKKKLYQDIDSTIMTVPKQLIDKIQKKLLEIGTRQILTSDLIRSIQTAQLFDFPIKTTALLNEFKEPSDLAGKKITDSDSYIFKTIDMYDKNPDFREKDGESLKNFIDRIISFRDFLENDKSQAIVCVGHGFFIRIFALLILVKQKDINSNMLMSVFNMKLDKLNYASFIFKNNQWFIESLNKELECVSS